MLNRREGESKLEHHKRLIMGKLVDKTLSDVDYVELSKEVYQKEFSSDVARRMMYGSRDTLQLLEDEGINNISEDSILDGLTEKQQELKKERMKLQDINREYNKALRKVARGELFEDLIVEAIRENSKPLHIPELKVIKNRNKEGILLLADSHYGKEMIVKSVTGEIINEYSTDIFKQRMFKLMDETVAIIKKEGLETLHIFNLGDSIEGVIRFKMSLPETGILTAIMEYIAFMRDWLNELSKYVKIEYYQNLGNHSSWRILDSKDHKDTFPQENAERLVVWSLRTMLEDNKNIKLHDEQVRGLVYTDILGYKFLASHGEKVGKLENAIKDYSSLYSIDVDYLLVGHKHFNATMVGSCGGSEVIQCASIVGVDEYAIELKKSNKAGSRLLIVEEGKGKTIDYNIQLN